MPSQQRPAGEATTYLIRQEMIENPPIPRQHQQRPEYEDGTRRLEHTNRETEWVPA